MTICKVQGQSIHTIPNEVLASGQVDFARFRFEFSDDWDGLDKTAQFTQNETTYNMHLGTGTPVSCYMPSEITDGVLYVSVFGVETGGTIVATTAVLRLRVLRAGYTDGEDSTEPTPSLYAQLLEEIDERIAAAITDGTDGQDGADGTSAYIVVEETDTGATITATDANGTTTATITNGTDGADGADGATGADGLSAYEIWLNAGNTGTEEDFLTALKGEKGDTGEQGAQGEQGADGVSPTVTLEETEDGVTITITDANGTTTANLTEGADGKDGYSPTVEVFKQAAIWGIDSGTAYFEGDTTATTFDVSSLDSVELVCWWISSGDSVPLTVTLTDANGSTTTSTATLAVGESITLDTSNASTLAITTSSSQTATGQLIYNDETAEGGYYLKITWYNEETGETETIITDNLKGSNGSDGSDGADGYSPSATVTQTDTGATITITDQSGTTTATITNGTDGSGGDSDLTGGETDYGVIDISDNVVTLSSAVGMSTGSNGAEIFNNYTGNTATGSYSTAMGSNNYATGDYSTAMGQYSTASGGNSLAACAAQAQGDYSIAMGISCVAGNMYSVAIGNTAKTTANHGISIGYYTTASGEHGIALGTNTGASGSYSTAMGQSASASGMISTATGQLTSAKGTCSTAMGQYTIAASDQQTAIGKFNIEDSEGTYAFIIGNGTSDDARSNLLQADWDGNVTIGGDLIFNGETSLSDSLGDTGWVDATITSMYSVMGSSSTTTLQYRIIGNQLYIKGSFVAASGIEAGSAYTLDFSTGVLSSDCGASGSGYNSSVNVTFTVNLRSASSLYFYFPQAITSSLTYNFYLSGTID